MTFVPSRKIRLNAPAGLQVSLQASLRAGLQAGLLAGCVALMGASVSANTTPPATHKDRIVADMISKGYTEIRTSKSFFGRTRIYGARGDEVWIVIIDPETGRRYKDKHLPRYDPASENTPDGTGMSPTGNPD